MVGTVLKRNKKKCKYNFALSRKIWPPFLLSLKYDALKFQTSFSRHIKTLMAMTTANFQSLPFRQTWKQTFCLIYWFIYYGNGQLRIAASTFIK
jgi:hypothetical protein